MSFCCGMSVPLDVEKADSDVSEVLHHIVATLVLGAVPSLRRNSSIFMALASRRRGVQAADILVDEKTSAEVCPLLADTLIDREVQGLDEAATAVADSCAGLAAANRRDDMNRVRHLHLHSQPCGTMGTATALPSDLSCHLA